MVMNDTAKRRRSGSSVGRSSGLPIAPGVFIVSVSGLIKMQIRHAQARPRRRTVVGAVLSYNPHYTPVSYVPLFHHIVFASVRYLYAVLNYFEEIVQNLIIKILPFESLEYIFENSSHE